jgi:glycosyltransferase involved in cell wall biosynthesis
MAALSAKLTPGFTLVIPAWNEQARLEKTLERYVPAFERVGKDFEIVVVTDGCTDGSKSVVERMAHRGVRLLEFPDRLGKGAAIFEGLDVARYDRLGFADADGPVSPEDLLRVVGALDHADCAIASRRVGGATLRVPRPFMRDTLSRGWNLLVRGALFLPFHDTQCGVKFLRRSAYDCVREPAKQFRDWAFDVGLLVLLHRAKRSITEVPVSWSEEEGSKFNVIRDAPRMLRSLIGIRLMSSNGADGRFPEIASYSTDAFGMTSPRLPDRPPSPAPAFALAPAAHDKILTPAFAPEARWNDPTTEL